MEAAEKPFPATALHAASTVLPSILESAQLHIHSGGFQRYANWHGDIAYVWADSQNQRLLSVTPHSKLEDAIFGS